MSTGSSQGNTAQEIGSLLSEAVSLQEQGRMTAESATEINERIRTLLRGVRQGASDVVIGGLSISAGDPWIRRGVSELMYGGCDSNVWKIFEFLHDANGRFLTSDELAALVFGQPVTEESKRRVQDAAMTIVVFSKRESHELESTIKYRGGKVTMGYRWVPRKDTNAS
jgi:hypothetical protein